MLPHRSIVEIAWPLFSARAYDGQELVQVVVEEAIHLPRFEAGLGGDAPVEPLVLVLARERVP